jgi:hypothetical protein
MPSPFPGVDPFLEFQGYWKEFHLKSINDIQEWLAERVPNDYEVRIGGRLSLLSEPDCDAAHDEEVSEPRIEIRRFPNREFITAIEVLSPSNKQPPGDRLYEEKRLELIHQMVHLVELDLLIGGERLPMEDELPEGHYYAFVSRAERRFLSDTYVWTIRDPLPRIPIPLKSPDPDILLDLAAIFEAVYQRARWGRSIDYAAPLKLPLSREDRAWAESLARSALPHGPR